MKKEIRFSSTIDTKEFDRAVESMQRKLQQVYQRSDQSRMQFETKQAVSRAGLGAAPSPAERARADQEDRRIRREMDKFIKDQVKESEAISRELNKQINQRKELLKLNQQDAEVKKKIADVEKTISTSREKQRMTDEAIRQGLESRDLPGYGGVGGFGGAFQRGAAAFRGAGMGGAGFGGRMAAGAIGFGRGVSQFAAANPLGFFGSVAGGVGAGLGIAGEMYQQYAQAPREVLAGQGQATRSLTSPLMAALSRGALEQVAYGSERSRAMEMASDEIKKTKRADLMKFGSLVAVALAGAALSATGLGASVGVPMMLSSAVGGVAAGAAGIQAIRYGTGSYQAGLEAQRAQMVEQNFQSLKNLNPLKQVALERYQQESMANLPFQRALGLSDAQMEAQLRAGAEAGFTTDITRQAMGGILGAGGSTRAGRGMATRANILERNLGLTNAAQTIGRISALTGGEQQTSSALTKILAEAFSLGLDDSEFRQEQAKFVDSATELITRTGALTPETQGALTRGLGEFVTGGRGMAEIGGAKTAFGLISQTTATTQGARGAIQASILNKDPRFKDLNIDERNALLSLSEEQILAGGPLVEGILEKTGMSAKDLIQTVKRPAFITGADVEAKAGRLKEISSKTGPRTRAEESEFLKLRSEVLSGMGRDNAAILKLQPAEQDALLKGYFSGGTMSPEDQKSYKQAQQRLTEAEARGPETAGDKIIAGMAAGDKAMIDLMSTFKNDLSGATDGAKKLAEAASQAAKTIQDAYKPENFDAKKVQQAIDNLTKILNSAGGPQGPRGSALVQEKGAPGGQ